MPELTRTVRFEVTFPGWTKTDKFGPGGLYERLWTAMSDLTRAANLAVSHLYLHHTAVAPLGDIAPRSLAYALLAGSKSDAGVPAVYVPSPGLRVCGGVISATADRVFERLAKPRQPLDGGKKLPGWILAQQGREALPTFRELPLHFRAAEVDVRENRTVALKVWAGRGTPLVVAPRELDASKRTILGRVVDGTYKQGGARLIWDRRAKKWFLALSWTGPVEAAVGDLIAGVHLDPHGRVHLGYCMADGKAVDRHDRLAIPQPVQRGWRRLEKEREALLNETAKARGRWRGAGQPRVLRVAHRRLGEAVSQMADAAVQQTAAAVVATAQRAGAAVLVTEDISALAPLVLAATDGETAAVRARIRRAWFSRRLATLLGQIRQVAEREGLRVVIAKRIPWKDVTTDADAARKLALAGVVVAA